ncbi:MAG TPA: VTT domain-containing protein [Vicinamibacterales bacterium]|jgi:Uncharacterized conserved protein|nr:VTT domain-containing protein [Vicinamibacterales bacterium]
MSRRYLVLLLWAATASAALYVYFFDRELLQRAASALVGAPPIWAYALYLVLGCLRGFTLVPATYLVLAGMLVLPPVPLYLLTLAGIAVSSAAVYLFAEVMELDRFFERHYAPQVARLRDLLARREFPIVVVWSFFPIAPTDLICYVCGALKVDLKKCLLGVTLGEGTICAIYIFLGGRALAWLR